MSSGKKHVMQVIFALEYGGAESLALNISSLLGADGRFEASLCGIFGDGGPLAAVAEKRGVHAVSMDAGRRGKVRTMLELYRHFRRERVALVQVHGSYLIQFVLLPALLAGVELVYTEHARHSLGRHAWLRWMARLQGLLFRRMVCVSQDLRTFMVERVGIRPERIEVIHNGIDLDRFRAPGPADVAGPGEHLTIGTVARLVEAKDHGNLLRAFARVRAAEPDVRLRLVGDGDLRDAIEALATELGLGDAVELAGKRSDIPEQLAGMDIFVLSSSREGFPVSLIEAMACSRPVVATDVGGVGEIVEHGVDGLVVPPQDHEALASAILGLVSDRAGRERMGRSARAKVEAHFSDQAMLRKYMRLFENSGGGRA